MSEPTDCRCSNCHCWIGTRNPDGICQACANGQCQGEPRFAPHPVSHQPAWVRRAWAHDLPVKVYH